jgi:L-lactate permease
LQEKNKIKAWCSAVCASGVPYSKKYCCCCCSGVGGFNTPIALGAPMLASLGHDPLTSLLVVVVFNTLASHMGSMGMAVWFGFKILGEQRCKQIAM